MPTISMFYGIIIRMYYDYHNSPHFHAYYNGNEAVISFDGELVKGEIPKKQLKLVQAWSIIHKEELNANWSLCKNSEEPFEIKPLY